MPPYRMSDATGGCRVHGGYPSHDGSTESWLPDDTVPLPSPLLTKPAFPCSNRNCIPDVHVHRACAGVRFIARHTRLQEDSTKVIWLYFSIHHFQTLISAVGVIVILSECDAKNVHVTVTGERRLEICCNGVGPTIFMDIHTSSSCGDSWNHPASSFVIRRQGTNRQEVF